MLADRMHAMRSLGCQPPYRRERIARETMHIYIPLVRRLGLRRIERELEDIGFRHLQPDAWGRINAWLEKRRPSDDEYTREVITALRGALNTAGIRAALKGGIKHACGIYQELTAGNLDLEETAVIIVNVIVKNKPQCYETLGLASVIWRLFPDTIRDHIATPTAGMNQGLYATLIGRRAERVELRIRTMEMDRRAQRGLLCLWWNKGGDLVNPQNMCRFDWLRETLEVERQPRRGAPHGDPFWDDIVVFTPQRLDPGSAKRRHARGFRLSNAYGAW